MSEPVYGEPRYLVLHFLRGQLDSTKISHSWRGAMMSKQNHERPFREMEKEFHIPVEHYSATTRIIPMESVLAIKGVEGPDAQLTEGDLDYLKEMGIA